MIKSHQSVTFPHIHLLILDHNTFKVWQYENIVYRLCDRIMGFFDSVNRNTQFCCLN